MEVEFLASDFACILVTNENFSCFGFLLCKISCDKILGRNVLHFPNGVFTLVEILRAQLVGEPCEMLCLTINSAVTNEEDAIWLCGDIGGKPWQRATLWLVEHPCCVILAAAWLN